MLSGGHGNMGDKSAGGQGSCAFNLHQTMNPRMRRLFIMILLAAGIFQAAGQNSVMDKIIFDWWAHGSFDVSELAGQYGEEVLTNSAGSISKFSVKFNDTDFSYLASSPVFGAYQAGSRVITETKIALDAEAAVTGLAYDLTNDYFFSRNAEQELANITPGYRTKFDGTRLVSIRLVVNVAVVSASANSPRFYLRYSTDESVSIIGRFTGKVGRTIIIAAEVSIKTIQR